MTAQDNSGVPSWCLVGAKVVCVNGDTPSRGYWSGDPLTPNAVYSITGYADLDGHGEHGLLLAGLDAGRFSWGGRRGYLIHRFRPLVTRSLEQDVSQFTHLLSGTPVDG